MIESKKRSNERIYAVYKGDEFIDVGTKKELSKSLGCQVDTISFYLSPAYKKRVINSDKAIHVCRVEED